MGRIDVEAWVLVNGLETPYRRAGRGRCVLLLAHEGREGLALFDELAAERRVIWPELTASVWNPDSHAGSVVAPAQWVRDLIDGLGLDRPEVIVDRSLTAKLGALLETGDDRIGAVRIVPLRGAARTS